MSQTQVSSGSLYLLCLIFLSLSVFILRQVSVNIIDCLEHSILVKLDRNSHSPYCQFPMVGIIRVLPCLGVYYVIEDWDRILKDHGSDLFPVHILTGTQSHKWLFFSNYEEINQQSHFSTLQQGAYLIWTSMGMMLFEAIATLRELNASIALTSTAFVIVGKVSDVEQLSGKKGLSNLFLCFLTPFFSPLILIRDLSFLESHLNYFSYIFLCKTHPH